MERATITAKGKVQRAGYRDYVLDLATELGVVGYVENQLDGTVLIVGEAEKDILEDFIRKLKPEDDPLINVDKTDIKYEKPTGEFKYFEIRRGSSDEESGERLDTAQKALKVLIKTTGKMNVDLGNKIDKGNKTLGEKIDNVADKQDQMLDKQDQMREDMNKNFTTLGEKIDQGFTKMDENFTTLGGKIDNVSSKIDNMSNKLDSFHQDTVQKFDRMDTKYDKVSEKMDSIDKTLQKLTEAILLLAKSKT